MAIFPRSLATLALVALVGVPLAAQQPTQPAPQPAPTAAASGTIVGFIFDSTIMRPLAMATVQIVTKGDVAHGKSFNSVTDSSGFFRITDVPPGAYIGTFFHERLDQLGVEAPLRELQITGGRNDIEFGIPGRRRIVALHCGVRPRGDSSGVVLGTVTKADSPDPVPNATVTAQWFELSFGPRGMVRSTPTVRATSDANGRFAFCGLPPDANFTIWASAGRASTGAINVAVPPFSVANAALVLDVADTLPQKDSTGAPVRRGTARVSGVVRGPGGAPLPGARVGIRGTLAETVADANGAYNLVALPAGTQTLEARAIGYLPITKSVTLSGKRALALDIHFDSTAHVLEAVDVRGKQVLDRATEDFNKAKQRGFGYFMDRETIESRQAFQASDLLRAAPGVTLYPSGTPGGSPAISIRGGGIGGGTCQPGIVIDGMMYNGGAEDLDMLVKPDDIAGLAVYRGASETPVEYQGQSSCGVIQVWTRRGNTPRGPSRK